MRVLAISSSRGSSPSPAIGEQLIALERMGVEIDRLNVEAGGSASYLMAAARVMCGGLRLPRRYDVIHGFYGHCGAVARAQIGAPVVVTFQGTDLLGGSEEEPLFRQDGMIGRAVACVADGVIVMTQEMKRASKRADALVQPFGINTARFQPGSQSAAREVLGLRKTGMKVLFPWHPERPEKNYPIAEQAVRRLQGAGLDVELVPVFSRPPDEVAQYMVACDALVLVSRHEGAPVAVREALACGLPVVSVNVGDVAELLEGLGGCHIVERTPDAVADGLYAALRYGRCSEGVKRLAELDVAWAARRVLELYHHVIDKGWRRSDPRALVKL